MTAKVFALRSGRKSSQYKLLHLTQRSGPSQSSRLFFVSRTTDLRITAKALHFPTILTPDYISNHVDQLHEATTAVELARCSQRSETLTLEHATPLLAGLSSRWKLLIATTIPSVTFREVQKTRFRLRPSLCAYSSRGGADVSLWHKAGTTRLLVRCNNSTPGEEPWTSATLPVSVDVGDMRGAVVLPLEEMQQGSRWDLGSVQAVGKEGESGMCKRCAQVELEFGKGTERQAFCAVVRRIGKEQLGG